MQKEENQTKGLEILIEELKASGHSQEVIDMAIKLLIESQVEDSMSIQKSPHN